jgi:predicted AAA+ superfamily ATPase
METALILHNSHWSGKPFDIPIKRDLLGKLMKFHKTKEIQIISGIRRSGKSSLLKLYINELIKEVNPLSILYVNFDDPNFSEVFKNPEKLFDIIEFAQRMTKTKTEYLFFDEIQMVSSWEKFVKSVYDADVYKKICITGSNSELLDSNYSVLLSGRYIAHRIFPLSLPEILHHNNLINDIDIHSNRANVLNIAESMIKYGSFPEIIKATDEEIKHEIALNYFDSIIIKDCIANNNIRDTVLFKELSYYLFNNISSMFSYNGIAKSILSNDITVKEYINVMKNAFLLYELSEFSFKIKQQIKSKRKIYCIDNGLISSVSLNFSQNKGQLFENFIFAELLKMGYKNIFFHNENHECDFIIKHNSELIAIQICYELNEQNKKREINGLLEVKAKYATSKSYLITFSQSQIFDNKISAIPVYELYKLLDETND